MQKIEYIIIGNELLNGKIKDLNTHALAKELANIGLSIDQVHIIPDDPIRFEDCLKNVLERANIVIMSGGLGPTKDDLTKPMLAKFFNKEISFSQDAYDLALLHYKRGKREFDQEKIDYQNIPDQFFPILNPIGYAPGLGHETGSYIIFATPGVPSEFESMIKQEIIPRILKKFPQEKLTEQVIVRTWKIPEAKIFTELSPKLWEDLESYGQVSSLPHYFGVDIGVEISASNKDELTVLNQKVLTRIQDSEVNEYIWQLGSKSLEEYIVEIASQKKLTFGFAESCTGGQCASLITNVPGASAVFWGSIISYANEVKIKSLNVSKETLKNYGAVSLETAKEMAIGARNHLEVDIAITTTGIAGPGGGSVQKPVGTIGIGVATKELNTSKVYQFQGNRDSLKMKFTNFALMNLLEEILKH
jgi:nicotinamide-nucleotide amidase